MFWSQWKQPHLCMCNILLEHESVNTEEAESTPSSNHKCSPGFINVAASTERHLEHFSLKYYERKIILQGTTDHAMTFPFSNIMKGKASLTMPARAPLRVIRKLHFPSPTRCQRNCNRWFWCNMWFTKCHSNFQHFASYFCFAIPWWGRGQTCHQ